jgi:hypothetical protein
MGERIMTRNFKVSLLVASMLLVLWTTASEACCWRRRACNRCNYQSGCTYGSPTGYYTSGQAGYGTSGGGYYGGGNQGGYGYAQPGYAQPGYAQPGYAQPGYAQPGYAQPGYAQPGYNPGGLGGPASGIGVRPGMGAGGFGPGR